MRESEMVRQGTFGFGVFECNGLIATYGELKSNGVEFTKPPTEEFYGFEALFKDNSGNWFSLGQKKQAETEDVYQGKWRG